MNLKFTKMQGCGNGTKLINGCAEFFAQSGFIKIRLAIDKGNPQSERRCPRGLIIRMGPNLRKKFPIQIGFLITFRIRHALLIDFTQYHMRKTFF